jgi:hypothetical protein
VPVGIAYATLTKIDTPGTGSVTYYLSNDNGATWEGPVTPGSRWTFANLSGTQLKYKIVLTGNATVSSLSITYNGLTTSTLSNLKKDATADSTWVNIGWNATLPANTELKFRTRGATQAQGLDALYSSPWSDYYVATSTGTSSASIKANGPSGAPLPIYRYIEVEVTMISDDGVTSPSLDSITLNYALNGAPSFNPDYPNTGNGGAVAGQISTSTDSDWGKVRIDYTVKDVDATSGSVNPGFISPSFQYRLNSGDSWHPIDSSYLDADALGLKPVLEGGYTTYSAYWDPQSEIPNQFSNAAQIRVLANDNELVYNVGYATTSAFTLDTTPPAVSFAHINGSSSTSTVSLNATDDTAIAAYDITNDPNGGSDGLNSSSGVFETASSSSLNLALPWTLDAGTSTHAVYAAVRDLYGNTSTTTIIAPITPPTFEIHDLSNTVANLYKFFVAWTPFSSASGATFSKYELWRSTDGSNFSLFQTLTDSATNYDLDSSVSSTTTYYYKMRTVDTNGDSSAFTDTVHALPQGLGGSSLPPNISSVSVSDIKNTSAKVDWATNGLANSLVYYGTSNSYGSTRSLATYATDHEVYLTNLQPNTTYYLKVSSTDFYGNAAADDNGGAGYTFTTNGGPVVSNVTVNSIDDKSATVFWNTDRDADSKVFYSINADLSGASQVGSSALVGTTTTSGMFSHSVTLSGLTAATTYYFYVSSTDADDNATLDTNSGRYYSFLTTRDTTPPVISNISEPVMNSTSAVVVWQTDKLSDTQLEWGDTASTTEGGYPHVTNPDSTPTVFHIATVTGLDPTTTYYFRARSVDPAGNTGYSDEQSFTTPVSSVTIINAGGGGGGSAADTSPPTLGSVSVDPINSFDATVNVSGSPEFRAVVEYGPVSSSTPNAPYPYTAGDAALSTSKKIKLTGLKPGTTYHYVVTIVKGANGVIAQSKDAQFSTQYLAENLPDLSLLTDAQDLQSKLDDIIQSALPSILPPFISTPTVSSTTENSAIITWGTNLASYGMVDYTTDDAYKANSQTYTDEVSDVKNSTTTHSLTLQNLQPNTTYHFSARAFVFPQVVGKSADFTFNTLASPITPQVIDVQPDSFKIGWVSDSKTSSEIAYTDQQSGVTQTISDKTLTTQHFLAAENLASGHTFSVQAYGYDSSGNRVGSDKPVFVTTTIDRTQPAITALRIDSNLVPGRTDIIQSIVSWKTDKPSTSAVFYEEGAGTSDQALKNKVENDTGYVQDHVVILPSLKPSTSKSLQLISLEIRYFFPFARS